MKIRVMILLCYAIGFCYSYCIMYRILKKYLNIMKAEMRVEKRENGMLLITFDITNNGPLYIPSRDSYNVKRVIYQSHLCCNIGFFLLLVEIF